MMSLGPNTNPSTCNSWPYRVEISDDYPTLKILQATIWLETLYPIPVTADQHFDSMFKLVGNGWILKDRDLAVELVFRYGS